MPKKTRLKVLAGVALAVTVLLLAALTFTWESEQLSRAVLGALSGPDLEVQAASVRMNALRGVLLRDVTLRARLADGVFDLKAEELRLAHRFWRLLRGEVAIDEIVFVEPDASLVWDAPAPPGKRGKAPARNVPAAEPAPAEAAGGLLLAMSVRRLALEDGSFAMSEAGTPGEMVRFDGLDLELGELRLDPTQKSALAGLSANGTVAAQSFAGSGVVALGVTGKIGIGESRVQLSDLALPIDFGTLRVSRLDLDLGRDPYVFSLEGGGDPLLTAKLLGAASGFGNGALDFAIAGDGSPRGAPRGRGSLAVAAGTLGDMPLLSGVEALLVGTRLVGRPYSAFKVPFELDDGDNLTLAPFAIEAGTLRLGAYGKVDLEGPLDLHLELSLPRAEVSVKEMPDEVLEALTDVDGRVKLQIRIAGTIERPAVRFDTRAWAGLAGRRLAAEALKRLFGG